MAELAEVLANVAWDAAVETCSAVSALWASRMCAYADAR